MKKYIHFLATVLIVLSCGCLTAFASPLDTEAVSLPEEGIEMLDFEPVNTVIKKTDNLSGIDLKDLSLRAIKGQLDLSPQAILQTLLRLLFRELAANLKLIQSVFVIAVLSAILKNLSDSFQNKSVGELGFYVSYMALVVTLFASFQAVAGIATALVGDLTSLMQAALPLMLSLIVMSGQISGAAAFQPVMVYAIHFITFFVSHILTPVLILGAVVEIVNYLTEHNMLAQYGKLIRQGGEWALKIMITLFMGILSLQKLSAPLLDNLAIKTARASAGAVPVVGSLLGGAVDAVMYFTSAAKSGVMVALLVVILLACLQPIMEILGFLLVYKLLSAAIQPICDARIVKCIEAVGSFTALLLGASVITVIMFLFAVMILLSG